MDLEASTWVTREEHSLSGAGQNSHWRVPPADFHDPRLALREVQRVAWLPALRTVL